MDKRFYGGKDDTDFTEPRKLTWQKRWIEAPEDRIVTETRHYGSIAQLVYGTCLSRRNNTGSNPVGVAYVCVVSADSTSAFQAERDGSNPFTHSILAQLNRQSVRLLTGMLQVQVLL